MNNGTFTIKEPHDFEDECNTEDTWNYTSLGRLYRWPCAFPEALLFNMLTKKLSLSKTVGVLATCDSAFSL